MTVIDLADSGTVKDLELTNFTYRPNYPLIGKLYKKATPANVEIEIFVDVKNLKKTSPHVIDSVANGRVRLSGKCFPLLQKLVLNVSDFTILAGRVPAQ